MRGSPRGPRRAAARRGADLPRDPPAAPARRGPPQTPAQAAPAPSWRPPLRPSAAIPWLFRRRSPGLPLSAHPRIHQQLFPTSTDNQPFSLPRRSMNVRNDLAAPRLSVQLPSAKPAAPAAERPADQFEGARGAQAAARVGLAGPSGDDGKLMRDYLTGATPPPAAFEKVMGYAPVRVQMPY